MDIEVPAKNPRTFSHIKRNGRHLLQLETVLMTVYYPSALGSGSGTAPGGEKNWARQTWLPRPRVRVSQGYGRFAGVGNLILPFFGATNIFTKLPAFRNAALASHWPEKDTSGSNKEKDGSSPTSTSDAEPPKFPLLFFSHGLGGLRTTYSSLCGEFASYGFVCVALEHRDGSCPRTFVCHPRDGEGSIGEREEKGAVDHSTEEKRQNFDVIDYIWPKDNPYDTAPTNDKGPDFDLRHAQMDLRMAEVDEAYHVICELVKGNGQTIARQNMRSNGFIGGNSRGLKGIDWPSWKDRVYLDRVTMIGHSFGSATTVKILRDTSNRFSYISQGIIYDIWGQPLTVSPSQASPNEEKKQINTPLLAINSEAAQLRPCEVSRARSSRTEHTRMAHDCPRHHTHQRQRFCRSVSLSHQHSPQDDSRSQTRPRYPRQLLPRIPQDSDARTAIAHLSGCGDRRSPANASGRSRASTIRRPSRAAAEVHRISVEHTA